MDDVPEQAQPAELAALSARVAELERIVAELRGAREVVIRPQRREPAPPPPRMPFIPLAVDPDHSGEPPPPVAVREQPSPPTRSTSFEDRLGSQIFNMVGILALILGTAYGLKLAIEHGLIGPVARVVIGLVAGAGIVLWSEVFRRKTMVAFSYSLKAVGTAVLYLSLWAAFQLYHLLPASVALAAMILVTAWNVWMALSQDAELLAGYALAGGLLTPLLLSTGGDHEGFLFIYLAAIDMGIVYLLRTRTWRWLILPSFLGTVLYFSGWFGEFFQGVGTWTAQSTETAAFAILFFAIFALLTLRGWVRLPEPQGSIGAASLEPVLLPLANAAFLAAALFAVVQSSNVQRDARAWLMVALAALLLGLMRLQRSRISAAMQLAAAVVCLTIAVPLKASGHTLTTAWLVEGLVLYWAGTRFEEENGASSKMLWVLSLGGYALGLGSLVAHWWWFGEGMSDGFLNRNLAAALVAVVTLAGTAWLASTKTERHNARPGVVVLALLAINAVAVLLAVREIASTWEDGIHPAFANPQFYTAAVGLAILAAAAWAAFRGSIVRVAEAITVVFHLVAILSIEREIGALWSRSDANVQRSLAISGFLMLYGSGLLAAGFVRRNAFVRWQGLALLLFTICKVFLYDIASLSAGYRVASFMGLGAVLMGVSYAYQKDWLGLKASHADTPNEEAPQ